MKNRKIGILNPGAMGISAAATMKRSGNDVYWVSEGRSEETHARANQHGLTDAGTLQLLCKEVEAIVCVCPPHAAETLAEKVAALGFRGYYLDANAISPQRAIRISDALTSQGLKFIDGSIIGGPAWEPGRTWLYLSGSDASVAEGWFSSGPMETAVLDDQIGSASAIKMCFAAYTKGSTALLCAILATAENLGVREALSRQWSRGGSDFAEQAVRRARGVTAKAWRFTGEMDEIAETFLAAGLPGGFHQASGEIYQRISKFKGSAEPPPIEDVLAALGNTRSNE